DRPRLPARRGGNERRPAPAAAARRAREPRLRAGAPGRAAASPGAAERSQDRGAGRRAGGRPAVAPYGGGYNPRVAVAELELIAGEVATCQKCPLAKGRLKAVPGEGPADAKVMLIGEGPGYHENQQGRPFVGPAGQ